MDIIEKYFPDLTKAQYQLLSQLPELYQDWNQKINVVSRKDVDELMLRHVLHSLAIAKYIDFPHRSQVIDIGTGGGFPGIPLAILFPEVSFTLLDSTAKKLKVIDEVAEQLKLENVKTIHSRAEEHQGKYDFIVSRAVAHMDTFTYWVNHLVQKNKDPKTGRIIYLKGGDLTEELQNYPQAYITPITKYFNENIFETKKIVDLKIR